MQIKELLEQASKEAERHQLAVHKHHEALHQLSTLVEKPIDIVVSEREAQELMEGREFHWNFSGVQLRLRMGEEEN